MNGYGTPMMAGGLSQMLGGLMGGLRPRRNPAFMQEQQLLPFNGSPQLGSDMSSGGLGAGMMGGMGGGQMGMADRDAPGTTPQMIQDYNAQFGVGAGSGSGFASMDGRDAPGTTPEMIQNYNAQFGVGVPSGGGNNLMQMLQQLMFRRGGRGNF